VSVMPASYCPVMKGFANCHSLLFRLAAF